MGRFSEEAKQAAGQTDKELADSLKELQTKNLSACFPNPADKKLVDELIAAVNKSTSRNELVTACQAITAKLTVEGAKALREGFQIAKKLAL
ncbi:MAG: hypothetical protein U1E51_17700 [Candidatus Binatia bacterium]|nr:hypothetical protein [Candidatus Binatia bacterium]